MEPESIKTELKVSVHVWPVSRWFMVSSWCFETSGKLWALPEENSRLEYGSVIRWIFSAKWTENPEILSIINCVPLANWGNNWFSINRSTVMVKFENRTSWNDEAAAKSQTKTEKHSYVAVFSWWCYPKKNRVPLLYGNGAHKMSRNFCENPEVGSVTLSQTHPWDSNLWCPV